MISDPTEIEAALAVLDVSLSQLWLDYVALGGCLLVEDLEGFIRGGRGLEDHDYDAAVQALNDRFVEQGNDHLLLYSDEIRSDS